MHLYVYLIWKNLAMRYNIIVDFLMSSLCLQASSDEPLLVNL